MAHGLKTADVINKRNFITHEYFSSPYSSLNIRKGSRTGNSGNNLELTVLTLMKSVP